MNRIRFGPQHQDHLRRIISMLSERFFAPPPGRQPPYAQSFDGIVHQAEQARERAKNCRQAPSAMLY